MPVLDFNKILIKYSSLQKWLFLYKMFVLTDLKNILSLSLVLAYF